MNMFLQHTWILLKRTTNVPRYPWFYQIQEALRKPEGLMEPEGLAMMVYFLGYRVKLRLVLCLLLAHFLYWFPFVQTTKVPCQMPPLCSRQRHLSYDLLHQPGLLYCPW